ncbi:DUF6894 family protein [Bradyrhizobium monzae]|uniref:DUF6894 family protein n=1 Tax=Bradyrhizobium sp. Oc8 TaxID=2876780 RepID=UPI001F38D295|nr:hypothetical protein [Bradyrhizobium sp. Oc8]
MSLEVDTAPAYSVCMRYFFHIVDKYGLCQDGTGYECADLEAAVLHARRLASELAKAGELFRTGFVLIAPRRRARIGKPV